MEIVIIILIYMSIGLILGRVFNDKLIKVGRDNSILLKENETPEDLAMKARVWYLVLWIPLFFIDYFAYFRV